MPRDYAAKRPNNCACLYLRVGSGQGYGRSQGRLVALPQEKTLGMNMRALDLGHPAVSKLAGMWKSRVEEMMMMKMSRPVSD